MVFVDGGRTRAVTRNGLMVSWADISIYNMSPEDSHRVCFRLTNTSLGTKAGRYSRRRRRRASSTIAIVYRMCRPSYGT